MNKVQRLMMRYMRVNKKASKIEEKISSYIAGANRDIDYELEKVKRKTAEEIYNLMIGEFEPYIDTGIAKEIAARFGVYKEVQS